MTREPRHSILERMTGRFNCRRASRLLAALATIALLSGIAAGSSLSAGQVDPGCGSNFLGASADGRRVFFTACDKLTSDSTYGRNLYESAFGRVRYVGPWRFKGMSRDGLRVFFETTSRLDAADTDWSVDVYERSGGVTRLVSAPARPRLANDEDAVFLGASADGLHVFFKTEGRLDPLDGDGGRSDIYERYGQTTRLVSAPGAGAHGTDSGSHRFKGSSSDGQRVFFDTLESLVAGDTDFSMDVYERFGGVTRLVSVAGPGGRDTALGNHAAFVGSSDDGSRVFFGSEGRLVGSDTDSSWDIYERFAGSTELVSQPGSGTTGFDAFDPVSFSGGSTDGARVFFQPTFPVTGGGYRTTAIYERSGGDTRLVAGRPEGSPIDDVGFAGASDDGLRVFFATFARLSRADVDRGLDVYERVGRTTRLVSAPGVGAVDGSSSLSVAPAWFVGASADGSRVFFRTRERLSAEDRDDAWDIYQRSGGITTLVTPSSGALRAQRDVVWRGASNDGKHVFFETSESLVAADSNSYVDVYERSGGVTRLVAAPNR